MQEFGQEPDISQAFSRQAKPSKLRVQVDSDHAGDAVTRRSTTGMMALYGEHVLTQACSQLLPYQPANQSTTLW